MNKDLYNIFLSCTGVSINSKEISPGNLFFGLKGTRVNGSMFAEEALKKGASCAIIDDETYNTDDERIILVEDSLNTLISLAKHHRSLLSIPFIAITGSCGKTTTKEMLAKVLQTKYKTYCTKGNFNTHIGTPLSILSIPCDAEVAIIEMGARRVGDIQFLCEIVKPTHGVILNVKEVHIESFGSLEGVLNAKSELYEYIRNNNEIVFINKDDSMLLSKSRGIKNLKLYNQNLSAEYFEINDDAPFFTLKYNGTKYKTSILGRHNIFNMSIVLEIADFLEVPREKSILALSLFSGTRNSLEIIEKE